jgi:hypothetical protein
VAKLAFASGQAAGDLPQRLRQLAKPHVNELVQQANPRACLSALSPLTALSNSCRGKACNICAKILHTRIHGGGVLKTEIGSWRDATSTYRRCRLTPQMPIWTRFGQD